MVVDVVAPVIVDVHLNGNGPVIVVVPGCTVPTARSITSTGAFTFRCTSTITGAITTTITITITIAITDHEGFESGRPVEM